MYQFQRHHIIQIPTIIHGMLCNIRRIHVQRMVRHYIQFMGILLQQNRGFPLINSLFNLNLQNPEEPGKMMGEKIKDCTYFMGFDPIWFIAENDLVFVNSFKMKFAVIVGVI